MALQQTEAAEKHRWATAMWLLMLCAFVSRAAESAEGTMQDIQFSPDIKRDTVTISFRLTAPAYIILRAHVLYPPFPVLHQIIPRELKQAGVHTLTWDGRDGTGEPLPFLKWQLILRHEPVDFTPTETQLEAALAEPPIEPALRETHHLHNPQRCGLIHISVKRPVEGVKYTGPDEIIVRRAGRVGGYGDKLGVGLQVFADGRKLGEIKLGPTEAAAEEYRVPAELSSLGPGKHKLHIVITDFADHFGTTRLVLDR
jgi:hypothetical protein